MGRFSEWFSNFSRIIESWSGSPIAFVLAVVTVVVWAATGPFFGWSEGHQLFINTLTTIITYLMVFSLQEAQNRDTQAIHVKLDELIRVIGPARNTLIQAEEADQQTLTELKDEMQSAAEPAPSAED